MSYFYYKSEVFSSVFYYYFIIKKMGRYYGGKGIIGKEVSSILLAHKKDKKKYIEPFCGGLGTLKHMAPHFDNCYASDISPDIILLWNAVKEDKFMRPNMTLELYKELKSDPRPSALRAYAGFFCSFLGSWFRSYVSTEDDNARYLSLLKYKDKIQNVDFKSRDYRTLENRVKSGSYFIYCDPPYRNTICLFGTSSGSNLGSNTKPFNHDEFWATVTRWRDYGNIVIVSEFTAPKGWKCIWSRTRTRNVNNSKTKSNKKGLHTERLFM